MRIKEVLKERGMTAKELCQRIGITETGLSLGIKNNQFPLSRLRQIAEVLGCGLSDLLRDEDCGTRNFVAVVKDGADSYVAWSWGELKDLAQTHEKLQSKGCDMP